MPRVATTATGVTDAVSPPADTTGTLNSPATTVGVVVRVIAPIATEGADVVATDCVPADETLLTAVSVGCELYPSADVADNASAIGVATLTAPITD